MKNFFVVLFTFFFTQLLNAQNRVLVVGIDGCRSDALDLAVTPNIDYLKNKGIFCPTSWQMGKTKSGPGWSSMLTGVWDNKHHVSNNKFTHNKFKEYPFLPTLINNYDKTKKSAIIVGWNGLYKIALKNGWNLCIKGKNDVDCLTSTSALLDSSNYDLVMVHFNHVDHVGHSSGFELSNKKYLNAIEEADRKIGQLLVSIKNRSIQKGENWLIICSTDHGGTGRHHARSSVEERKVWWLASSNDTQKMYCSANDPGSFFYKKLPQDSSVIGFFPSIVDVTATAINHIFPHIKNADFEKLGIDGKSWLNSNFNQSKDFYLSDIKASNAATSEKIYFNKSGSVSIKMEENE